MKRFIAILLVLLAPYAARAGMGSGTGSFGSVGPIGGGGGGGGGTNILDIDLLTFNTIYTNSPNSNLWVKLTVGLRGNTNSQATASLEIDRALDGGFENAAVASIPYDTSSQPHYIPIQSFVPPGAAYRVVTQGSGGITFHLILSNSCQRVYSSATGGGSGGSGASADLDTALGVTLLYPSSRAVEMATVDAALPGETIMFVAGQTYTNNNYLRRNVNYGETGPGVIFEYHHFLTNMTTAGQYAIFDERGIAGGANGTTNLIDLPGASFRYVGYSNAFIIDYATILDSDFVTFNTTATLAGALVLTNEASKVVFNFNKINSSWWQSTDLSAIALLGGHLIARGNIITNDLDGLAYKDSLDAVEYTPLRNIGMSWGGGSGELHISQLWGRTYAWVWFNTGTAVQDFRIYPVRITGKIYGDTANHNVRGWVIGAQEIGHLPGEETFPLIGIYAKGLWYFDSQVYRCENQRLYFSDNNSTATNSVTWIRGFKAQSSFGWARTTTNSELILSIDTYQDTGGITNGFQAEAGSVLTVNGGDIKTTGTTIFHAGGTAIFKNVTFQNTNGASVAVIGSGLTLMNCSIDTIAATNSLFATNAQTVTVIGSTTTNKPKHANITISKPSSL